MPAKAGLNAGREICECAKGAVDMEPGLCTRGDAGQSGKVVDGADIYGAGGADDDERLFAGGDVFRDGGFKFCNVDAVIGIGWDQAQGGGADAGHVHGTRDAAMCAGGGVGGELGVGEAVLPHLRPRARAGGRRARATKLAIEEPVSKTPPVVGGMPMISAAQAMTWRSTAMPEWSRPPQLAFIAPARKFRQHGDRIAAAMDPAHEAGMGVAGDIRLDGFGKGLV